MLLLLLLLLLLRLDQHGHDVLPPPSFPSLLRSLPPSLPFQLGEGQGLLLLGRSSTSSSSSSGRADVVVIEGEPGEGGREGGREGGKNIRGRKERRGIETEEAN